MSTSQKEFGWYHVHIPKTAGSSLNAMLSEVFGDEFQNHQKIENKANARIGSGHRTFRQVRSAFPDRKLFAILRDPVNRLRSEVQHHYSRRKRPRYHKLGNLFSSMIRDQFEPDWYILNHPDILIHCDNLMVRYLCSSPIEGRVSDKHLDEAYRNLEELEIVIFNESLGDGCQRLFDLMGAPCPVIRNDNRARIKKPIFEDLPELLNPFVRFDRELHSLAREKSRSTQLRQALRSRSIEPRLSNPDKIQHSNGSSAQVTRFPRPLT